MILNLFNLPRTPQDLAIFAFANQDHHTAIANVIFATDSGLRVDQPVLDPIPQFDFKTWALRHQEAHNAVNAVLGVDGFDLTDVDINDPKDFQDFIWEHAAEHVQWANKTGVF